MRFAIIAATTQIPPQAARVCWVLGDGTLPSDLPLGVRQAAERKLAQQPIAVIDTCGALPWAVLIVAKPPATQESVMIRRRFGAIARACQAERISELAIPLPDHADETLVELAVGGLGMGNYSFDRYQKKAAPGLTRVTLVHARAAGLSAALRRAAHLADAIHEARDWINTPAQDFGPDELEDACRTLARSDGLRITVHDEKACRRMKLGCLLGVGQGSHRRPRLIELELPGRGQPLAICGKGVCFDTGGLNLKPEKSMLLMRKDMGGAASVALALAAASRRGSSTRRVRAYLPVVENAIGPEAMRPGDVLTAGDGTTVEIGHTDAEGRLILADAMVRARADRVASILTVATLTGAAMVALGRIHVPLIGSDDATQTAIEQAAQRSGERVWRLPLVEDHHTIMKGKSAMLTNDGNGEAGCITAAAFLAHFAGNTPFAHLDISPMSWFDRPHELGPIGASGTMISTLVSYMEHA